MDQHQGVSLAPPLRWVVLLVLCGAATALVAFGSTVHAHDPDATHGQPGMVAPALSAPVVDDQQSMNGDRPTGAAGREVPASTTTAGAFGILAALLLLAPALLRRLGLAGEDPVLAGPVESSGCSPR